MVGANNYSPFRMPPRPLVGTNNYSPPCPCVFLCPQEMNMYTKPKYDPERYHRRSIRLCGYNYSCEGLYFVTICCHDKLCLFGEIVDGEMVPNEAGRMVDKCWLAIPEHFPHAVLHDYVIMPNHVHGIIELINDDVVGAKNFSHLQTAPELRAFRSPSKTIGSIIRGFKIGVTKWMRQHTVVSIVWQRNYYEHIIRCGRSYRFITEYILTNPANWLGDDLYIEPVSLPSRF